MLKTAILDILFPFASDRAFGRAVEMFHRTLQAAIEI
jgi:hypothetical protein